MSNNLFFKNKLKTNSHRLLSFYLFAMILMSSCKSYNLLQSSNGLDYFEEMKKESFEDYASIESHKYKKNENNQAYTLKVGDKISISIWNHDNLSIGSIFSTYSSNEVYGKWVLVNNQGNVTLPQIGKVHLLDLTVEEAEKKLINIYVKHIVDPLILVKVLNKKITVLGEVNRPGFVPLEKDRIPLYEVLGHVGGLNKSADSRNIKLIRNKKEYNIDLTTLSGNELIDIEIKASDLIYVPSQKNKNNSSKVTSSNFTNQP